MIGSCIFEVLGFSGYVFESLYEAVGKPRERGLFMNLGN
jgi:hypothetical protein